MRTTTVRRTRLNGSTEPTTKWAAAYVRQSVADDSEYGSIHAQREIIERYVEGRATDGWKLLPEEFTDHGISGATTRREALQRLLQRIDENRVHVVVVTRLDRISRSLRDAVNLFEHFRARQIEFVSTSQNLDSTTSVGKLSLNLLMSLSEFERDVVRERTREKLASARRGGRFCAGRCTLGYDLVDKKLTINVTEAEQVREMARIYLETKSLIATAEEARRRGWRSKTWRRKDGTMTEGRPIAPAYLHQLFRNPILIGKVPSQGELYPGVHAPILSEDVWRQIGETLAANNGGRWKHSRRPARALLQNMIVCATCGQLFHVSFSGTAGNGRKYGFYVCGRARSQGIAACAGSRAPIAEIDAAVLAQVRAIGRDPAIFESTLRAAREAAITRRPELEIERDRLGGEIRKLGQSRAKLVDAIANGGGAGRDEILRRLGAIDVENDRLGRELDRVLGEVQYLEGAPVDADDLKRVLEEFDGAWESLVLEERRRLLALVVERIEFDGRERSLRVKFRANGIAALSNQGDSNHE